MTNTIILKINTIHIRRSLRKRYAFKVGQTGSSHAPAPDFGTLQMPLTQQGGWSIGFLPAQTRRKPMAHTSHGARENAN